VRRRHIHLLFGMVAVTLASLTGWQCMQLQRAERVNQAISRASASDLDSTVPEAMMPTAASVLPMIDIAIPASPQNSSSARIGKPCPVGSPRSVINISSP